MKSLALAVLGLLLLAGCNGTSPDPTQGPSPTSGPTTGPTTGPAPRPGFDGTGAFDLVDDLLHRNGELRVRVPGHPDHEEAALLLQDRMDLPGWEFRWQNFTGQAYAELDKGAVSSYHQNCSDDDRERLGDLEFSNLVAVRRAQEPSDRLFLLGAHWDAKAHASEDPDPERRDEPVPGANDGASGVGLLLRLMRHFSDGDLDVPFDVGIVLFDGEDGFEDCHPLAGSIWHVAHLEPGEADRFLLLDMVGDPEARFVRESASVESDPQLVDLLWEHGHAFGAEENFIDQRRGVLDDHVPFIEAGIPAVDLIDYGRPGFPPYWHTTEDTLDKLSPEMLGLVGDVVWATMVDPRFDEGLVDQG